MPVTRKFLVLIAILFFGSQSLLAQISQGGFPLEVVTAKSASKAFIDMPVLSAEQLKKEAEVNSGDLRLKSLRFAHPFEVNLNPSNSGQWYTTSNNYNVWKLDIYSSGALSLNLIFDHFLLPAGAKLFLYNEDEDEFLGAFTSVNNKKSGKFAVSPVTGDHITVQYEVPKSFGTPNDFEIISVNHDFVGVTKSDRRPLGKTAGSCNVDINCDLADQYHELKNSVCRLFVDGTELCSGSLVNNTAEDRTPYVISAAHCYQSSYKPNMTPSELAEVTVYAFNYESPYCAPLDGDPSNSITGAEMKATHDSLDFSLVELSLIPPPSFRPYYAGWNHAAIYRDSTASIHHPWGDIKKISVDNENPTIASFNPDYTPNAFLRILKWDEGVTEAGSSGGGLFNNNQQLIGTLTGGAAICGNPVNDYFASLAVYWDYKSDSAKQVKHWLDPINSGVSSLDGKQFYSGVDLCDAFTNLVDNDEHANVQLFSGGSFAGYWGGTNSIGISEIVEHYSIAGNVSLKGVSFGVGKVVRNSAILSKITVNVYSGESLPDKLLYSKEIALNNFVANAMNFVEFDQEVQPSGDFFIGFDLNNMQQVDTFVLYQSLREPNDINSYFFRLNGNWTDFADNDNGAMCNVMEVLACNYTKSPLDTPVVELPENVWLYPNPARSALTIESDQIIAPEMISVFNLIGQEINVPLLNVEDNRVQFDMTGNTPGIYIVRFNYNDKYVARRFSLVPY